MKLKESDARALFEKTQNLMDPLGEGILDAVIEFVFKGSDGVVLHYDIRQGRISTCQGHHDYPDVVISTTLETWLQLVVGEIRPIRTYVSGQVEVMGDIVLAQKVLRLFQKSALTEKGMFRVHTGDPLYAIISDENSPDSFSDVMPKVLKR